MSCLPLMRSGRCCASCPQSPVVWIIDWHGRESRLAFAQGGEHRDRIADAGRSGVEQRQRQRSVNAVAVGAAGGDADHRAGAQYAFVTVTFAGQVIVEDQVTELACDAVI